MNVQRVVGLLKLLEGWRDFPYDDRSPWPRSEVGPEDCTLSGGQWKVKATGGTATIGYGETEAEFVARYWGKRITQAEALAKMAERVDGFSRGMKGCIKANLTDHQWEAVTCRSYQTGAGGFCRSETAALLNADNIDGALDRWRTEFAHPDRSEVEITHFLTPDDQAPKERTMKLVTRSEWGARRPKVVTPTSTARGVAVHWEGPAMGWPWPHSQCAGRVRGIQDFHMDTRGWVDIAYNDMTCGHGYVFEGRGPDVRNAANGGVGDDNGTHMAICYLGGEGDGFTPEGQDAINDAAEHLGVAAGEWRPHSSFVDTACPGDEITAWIRDGHPRSDAAPTPSKEDQLFSPSPIACTFLIASHSGLFLTSSGDTHQSGVVQRRADGSLNQRWQIVGHDDGTVSYVNRAGGLALDRPDYKTDAGTFLQVANTEYNDAQRWTYDEVAPYLGRLWAPGTNRLLDVHMASREEGAGLQLWYGNNDWRHQQFVFATTV